MKNSVNSLIKEARIKNGLTQKEISYALGYTTPQFISNWERGLSSPPVTVAKKLCKLLNIKPVTMRTAYQVDYKMYLAKYLR